MVARWLCLLALLMALPAQALDNFYAARIPVTDRTETALGSAASQALAEVLVRVSGSSTVLDLETVATAVSDARNRMSLYTYEDTDAGTVLFAQFDESLVKRVLRDAGATFWTESRPPVLLWLVVDEPFSRRFATVSEDGDLLRELARQFELRGVTLRLPLLDLEDAAALSPEMLWQKVMPRIAAASERYGTEHILVGRYVQLTSGAQIADWVYLDSEGSRGRQLQDRSAQPIVSAAVDLVVGEMAARYAVTLQPESVFEYIDVAVSGVESYGDYRAVLDIFSTMSVLNGVRVAEVDGDRLKLRVSGVGTAEALARLLPQRSRLIQTADPDGRRLELLWGQP